MSNTETNRTLWLFLEVGMRIASESADTFSVGVLEQGDFVPTSYKLTCVSQKNGSSISINNKTTYMIYETDGAEALPVPYARASVASRVLYILYVAVLGAVDVVRDGLHLQIINADVRLGVVELGLVHIGVHLRRTIGELLLLRVRQIGQIIRQGSQHREPRKNQRLDSRSAACVQTATHTCRNVLMFVHPLFICA